MTDWYRFSTKNLSFSELKHLLGSAGSAAVSVANVLRAPITLAVLPSPGSAACRRLDDVPRALRAIIDAEVAELEREEIVLRFYFAIDTLTSDEPQMYIAVLSTGDGSVMTELTWLADRERNKRPIPVKLMSRLGERWLMTINKPHLLLGARVDMARLPESSLAQTLSEHRSRLSRAGQPDAIPPAELEAALRAFGVLEFEDLEERGAIERMSASAIARYESRRK